VQPKSKTQGSRARSKRAQVAAPGPSQAALEVAERASKRVQGRETTVRYGFIQLPWERGGSEQAQQGPPPLARLMRGSKGAALRIRLYLALLWQAGGGRDERHSVNFPARVFAELLDLPDPESRGERRVREAIKVFERESLLSVEARPGKPSILYLLQEDGRGKDYTRPGLHTTAAKARGEIDAEHLFARLPPEFWTNGWALVLSAPALAMLLVLLVITGNGAEMGQWVSLSQRVRYGLSDDTWTRGIAELKERGLVSVFKAPVSRDFEWRRLRNMYSLDVERLTESPEASSGEQPRTATRPRRSRSRPVRRVSAAPAANDDGA
jgi:hypothetical protein